jgi:prevent-host-death family protein
MSPQDCGISPDAAPSSWTNARPLVNDKLTQSPKMVILMTMSSVPLAEVKAHLSEFVSRVQAEHERVTVTVHGKPSAVLMSTEDLESMEETIGILADEPLMRQLLKAEAEIAQGQGESLEQLQIAMAERKRKSSVD